MQIVIKFTCSSFMSSTNFFIVYIYIYIIYIYIICIYMYILYIYTLYIYIYIYICGIHHRRMPWSSYRKLSWVGFEPTTTEFRSDALTDWAIRPWVQLTLRANFQISSFVQCPISFRLLPSSVATFIFIEFLLR